MSYQNAGQLPRLRLPCSTPAAAAPAAGGPLATPGAHRRSCRRTLLALAAAGEGHGEGRRPGQVRGLGLGQRARRVRNGRQPWRRQLKHRSRHSGVACPPRLGLTLMGLPAWDIERRRRRCNWRNWRARATAGMKRGGGWEPMRAPHAGRRCRRAHSLRWIGTRFRAAARLLEQGLLPLRGNPTEPISRRRSRQRRRIHGFRVPRRPVRSPGLPHGQRHAWLRRHQRSAVSKAERWRSRRVRATPVLSWCRKQPVAHRCCH